MSIATPSRTKKVEPYLGHEVCMRSAWGNRGTKHTNVLTASILAGTLRVCRPPRRSSVVKATGVAKWYPYARHVLETTSRQTNQVCHRVTPSCSSTESCTCRSHVIWSNNNNHTLNHGIIILFSQYAVSPQYKYVRVQHVYLYRIVACYLAPLSVLSQKLSRTCCIAAGGRAHRDT